MDKIQEEIIEQYNTQVETLGEKRVFGVIHTENKNIIIIIPTQEELWLPVENKEDSIVQDIRIFFSTLLKCDLLNINFLYNGARCINPLYKNNFENLLKTEDLNIIKQNIQEIIVKSQTSEKEEIKFFKCISEMEKKAFCLIQEKINNKDNNLVSISEMIKETNISRPVFRSLLSKMEKYNIAEIENKGVKGTYIRFL